MKIFFNKYQGAGNDFIIIKSDGNSKTAFTEEKIKQLCDRRFGIGADGLMLLEKHSKLDFKMKYYNSDGREGSMCGNGGRCIVAFAFKNQLISNKTICFEAIDGNHEAEIKENTTIKLKMQNVSEIEVGNDFFFLNTGSPHYISFVENIDSIDTVVEGRKIRYNNRFNEIGTNVDFAKLANNQLFVKTYERGVEDETLSCGTGVTASALCAAVKYNLLNSSLDIKTKGGNLKVYFKKNTQGGFEDIWLEGPATFVFEGEIEV